MTCHGRRIHIHSGYLANKAIHPQKRIFVFYKSILCIRGQKEGGDVEEESLGQTIKFLSI